MANKNKEKEKLPFKSTTLAFDPYRVVCYKPNSIIDDEIFASKEAWLLHSRGSCHVFRDEECVATLSGLPKFGYVGDFHTHPNEVHLDGREVHLMEKENGEWFGVTVFRDPANTLYLCGGSKNVKLLCNMQVDEQYRKQDGWEEDMLQQLERLSQKDDVLASFAVPMMKKFMTDYASPPVLRYLTETKFTLLGESCNPETVHIVVYDAWHMRFFALQDKHDPQRGLMRMNPWSVRNQLLELGLPVPLQHVVARTEEEVQAAYAVYENKTNSEGAVVYIWGKHVDGIRGEAVWSIFKHKNRRYVMERALREKMKIMADPLAIKKRFNDLHVKVTQEECKDLLGFYTWCMARFPDATVWKHVFDHWPSLMNEFMQLPVEVRQATLYPRLSKKVVQFIGVPGVGKNAVAEQLLALIYESGRLGIYLDQDMCQRNVRTFLLKLHEYVANDQIDVLLIGKNAHDAKQRASIYGVLGLYDVDYFLFDLAAGISLDDVPELTARILARDHPSLTKETPDIEGIVTGFITSRQPFDPKEVSQRAFRLCGKTDVPWQMDVTEKVRLVSEVVGIPWCLPKRVPMYAFVGVQLENAAIRVVVESTPVGNWIQPLHVTLVHGFHTRRDQGILMELAPRLGETVHLSLQELVWNDRVAAIRVAFSSDQSLTCTNTHAHITIALIKGAKPIESNGLLEQTDRVQRRTLNHATVEGVIRGYWQ